MKQNQPCKFYWMGEWHNGIVIRWAGISIDTNESLYEVEGGGWHLYHHPKSLIIVNDK